MTMMILLSIAFSAALLATLCHGDPKRRRSARLQGAGQSVMMRRLIMAAACLPGLLWALQGNPAAFLVWLGGCGAGGWLITLCQGQLRMRHNARAPDGPLP